MANFDNQFILKRIVNKNFTFGDFNKYLENTYNANIYCPFHDHSYSGKGNAKLYYDEEQEIWVLMCFAKCGVKTAYEYLVEITIGREQKYNSVEQSGAWTTETEFGTKIFDDSGYILLKITENDQVITTADNPGYIKVRK